MWTCSSASQCPTTTIRTQGGIEEGCPTVNSWACAPSFLVLEPTASALQWIMANLVKRPDIQEAVRREIDAVVNADADEVGENVLGKLEYLQAVVMKTLRLHPLTSFAFRQVMEEDHVVHMASVFRWAPKCTSHWRL
ncbi:hypothetical protein VPH35_017802 [Triticum aestivum]